MELVDELKTIKSTPSKELQIVRSGDSKGNLIEVKDDCRGKRKTLYRVYWYSNGGTSAGINGQIGRMILSVGFQLEVRHMKRSRWTGMWYAQARYLENEGQYDGSYNGYAQFKDVWTSSSYILKDYNTHSWNSAVAYGIGTFDFWSQKILNNNWSYIT